MRIFHALSCSRYGHQEIWFNDSWFPIEPPSSLAIYVGDGDIIFVDENSIEHIVYSPGKTYFKISGHLIPATSVWVAPFDSKLLSTYGPGANLPRSSKPS